jgi:hypothetical protein
MFYHSCVISFLSHCMSMQIHLGIFRKFVYMLISHFQNNMSQDSHILGSLLSQVDHFMP